MDERQLEFIERFGTMFERFVGVRSTGLVWGWLVMSPKPQSLDDIAAGLSLSKASVSLYTRLLEQMGLIERVAVLGEKKVYYQASDRAWDLVVEFGIRKLEALKSLAQEGVLLTTDPTVKARLVDMQDSLNLILDDYKLFVDKFHQRNRKPDQK